MSADLKAEAQELTKTIRQQQIETERVTTERKQQEAQQQQQLEADLQKAREEQAEYEKQQAEIQKQIQTIEEQEHAQAQAEQLSIQERQSVTQDYDSQIAELQTQQSQKLAESHTAYWKAGGQKDQGMTRSEFNLRQEAITKNYQTRINTIQRARTTALHTFEFTKKYPSVTIGGSVGRTFAKTGGQASLIGLYESRLTARQARAERQRQTSITTAKSRAIQEREKLEFVIRGFELQKDQTQLRQVKEKLVEKQYALTKATKKKPQVYPSQYFLDIPSPTKQAYSIIGATPEKSRQAVQTFAETQERQKQLFAEFTGAEKWEEAIAIKSRYQEASPYVGTPQTYLLRGEVKDQYGYLIEKKLTSKFPTGTIKSFAPITTPKEKLLESPFVSVKDKAPDQIPTIIFLDEKGETKETTPELIWSYVSESLKPRAETKLPSKVSQVATDYRRDFAIVLESMGDLETHGVVTPLIDTKTPSFEAGFLSHAEELTAVGQNILYPEDKKEYTPTLETLAIEDVLAQGKFLFGVGEKPTESKLETEVEKRLEQERGLEYIAGSVFGSAVFLGASILAPPLAIAKYGKAIVQPKTIREAYQIAQKLTKVKKDPEFESLLKKYPEMPESEKQILRRRQFKAVPYGVEPIKGHPEKALITLGTETAPSKTPYIQYTRPTKFEPKAETKVYSVIEPDVPITPKEIIIKGKQAKELSEGVPLVEDFVRYPIATGKITKKPAREFGQKASEDIESNLAKVTDPASHLALVGTEKRVLSTELYQYPKEVIESITGQKVKRETVLLETEHLKYAKGTTGEIPRTKPPTKGEIPTEKKPTIPKTGEKITLDIPKKPSVTLETPTKPAPQARREELKEFAKGLVEKEATTDIKALGATAVIDISTIGLKSREAEYQSLTQAQQLKGKELLKTEILTKQEITTTQKEKLKLDLETIQQEKPVLDPRFSLIVEGGQRQDVGIVPKYIVEVSQEYKTDYPYLFPDDPTVPRRPPVLPTPPTIVAEEKARRQRKKKKSKYSLKYWRSNVDELAVGRYLPTKEFTVSKKRKKSWEYVDALQRTVHKKGYAEKIIKENKKRFGLSFMKKKGKKKGFAFGF